MNDAWETQYSTALSVWPVFSILIYHHLHEELPEVLESFAQRVTKPKHCVRYKSEDIIALLNYP